MSVCARVEEGAGNAGFREAWQHKTQRRWIKGWRGLLLSPVVSHKGPAPRPTCSCWCGVWGTHVGAGGAHAGVLQAQRAVLAASSTFPHNMMTWSVMSHEVMGEATLHHRHHS